MLYLNLLTYTKGDAYSRVVAGGTEDSFEAYRWVFYKGKNSTVVSLMERRMQVMSPSPAKGLDEIDAKVMQWKMDQRFLREARQPQDLAMLQNTTPTFTNVQNQIIVHIQNHMKTNIQNHIKAHKKSN